MRLLENLHQPWILLCVDEINVGVHVIVFKSFYTITLFFVLSILFFSFFLLQVSFAIKSISLNFHCTFFVKLDKLFLVVKNLFQEFFSTRTPSMLLATPHLLFEPVQSACFLLWLSEHLCSSIKISIHELAFKQKVSMGLSNQPLEGSLIIVIIREDSFS